MVCHGAQAVENEVASLGCYDSGLELPIGQRAAKLNLDVTWVC